MARWEYRYIDLFRGTNYTMREFSGFVDEVCQAGEQGWEAVGEVRVSYGSGNGTDIRVLMLKRRLDK